MNGMATRSCVGRGTTRSCASRNRNTVAAVFLPVRVLVPVPVGVAPAPRPAGLAAAGARGPTVLRKTTIARFRAPTWCATGPEKHMYRRCTRTASVAAIKCLGIHFQVHLRGANTSNGGPVRSRCPAATTARPPAPTAPKATDKAGATASARGWTAAAQRPASTIPVHLLPSALWSLPSPSATQPPGANGRAFPSQASAHPSKHLLVPQ